MWSTRPHLQLIWSLSAIRIVSSTVALCALSWRPRSIAVLRPPSICGPPGLPHRALCETLWQVLNLFHCLRVWSRAPGRLNDLRSWYLWRCTRDMSVSRNAILKLAAKHTTWFRLHRSSVLAKSNRVHGEPSGLDVLPGEQNAPSTALWKMDVIVWLNVLELMFQCGIDFFMWHYSHLDRPCLIEILNALFGIIYISREVPYQLEKYEVTRNGR